MDNLGTFFKGNFGGYVVALIIVLLLYALLEAVAPRYSGPIALVTLLGIFLFYFKEK